MLKCLRFLVLIPFAFQKYNVQIYSFHVSSVLSQVKHLLQCSFLTSSYQCLVQFSILPILQQQLNLSISSEMKTILFNLPYLLSSQITRYIPEISHWPGDVALSSLRQKMSNFGKRNKGGRSQILKSVVGGKKRRHRDAVGLYLNQKVGIIKRKRVKE